jgi:nucleoside diphosphate kinase/adenylate kinase family enzyme
MYKKEAVFMLGGPGSDRDGVAAALATQHTDHTLINVDELLASAEGIEKDKELIHEAMKNGKLVDAVTVTTAIKSKIMSSPGKKFLLNGFPRSKAELDQWAEMCSGDVFYDSVLYIDSALETMKANLLANEATAPIANTLLSTFVGSTIPIFDLFSRANKLRVIPTDGLPSAVSIEKASRVVRANSVLRPYERTFAMIKPDAVSAAGAIPAILEAIAGVNLSVVYTKLVQLIDDVAGAFYAEHSARPFFPRLKQFMTSGPVLVMVLEGTDAIRAWRTLMGPTNTQVAEKEAPNSLRARFGTDGTMNATHGSDAVHTAMREIDFWTNPECPGGGLPECILPSEMPEAQLDDFGEEMKLSEEEEMQKKLAMCASDIPAGTPLAVQDTYAMIKPLIAERNYTEIMDVLSAQGFTVVAETKVRLSHTQVELFYEEHKERPFFPTLVEYMTSGPVVALHLRREFAIGAWRHLIGPTNFDKAKNERPDSLRALFALDGTRNACHGSDSAGSARRELGFFFSIGACAPDLLLQDQLATTVSSGSPAKVATSSVPPVSPPKRYAGQVRAPPQINKADIALMEAYANYDVEPVMKELLQQLMITRPADVTGFALQTLASMHMKKGQELPAFPAESGVPLNRLNPIIASPRGGEASMDGKDPLPAIEDDAESTAAVGGE